jgi:hypothetical protein
MGREPAVKFEEPGPTPAPARVLFDGGSIGLSLARRRSDDRAVVVQVVPRGAAHSAGCVNGDAVTMVDGRDAGDYESVVSRLEGARPVVLGFSRGGSLNDIMASMSAVKHAYSLTKRADNEAKRVQKRSDAMQKRIAVGAPAHHPKRMAVSLMPPGGSAWRKIPCGAPPPLHHIRTALDAVSGDGPELTDDKRDSWYPVSMWSSRFNSLGHRTLKSMPAAERLQVKHDIEEQFAALKKQKGIRGLDAAELLRLKGLQGDLAGVTYWSNPTRNKNKAERLIREHGATLRRRTLQRGSIERELVLAEGIAATARRAALG